MIVAGEASGDQHGANLVKAIQKRRNDLIFCGIGGQALKAAGVEILVDAAALAVVGITEVLSKIPNLINGLRTCKRLLHKRRPDLLILIDFPDFNLRVAAFARKLGIRVLYYISPQIWAWRPGRVRKIGARVNHVAVILPFEEQFYKAHGIPVTFVGHPLLDSLSLATDTSCFAETNAKQVVGLLPGSRDKEVRHHIPAMLGAAALLKEQLPGIKFLLSIAPGLKEDDVRAIVRQHRLNVEVELVTGGIEAIFKQSDLVVAASGTVTLEAAIACKPMVIIYKVSPTSYWLGRALIRVKYISLANLIADEAVVPELIQDEASAKNIAATVIDMLTDTQKMEHIKGRLKKIRHALGGAGASDRTADIAIQLMEGRDV